jgi:hypothetical protein
MKPANSLKTRKLALRSETVVALTCRQLVVVYGGNAEFPPTWPGCASFRADPAARVDESPGLC